MVSIESRTFVVIIIIIIIVVIEIQKNAKYFLQPNGHKTYKLDNILTFYKLSTINAIVLVFLGAYCVPGPGLHNLIKQIPQIKGIMDPVCIPGLIPNTFWYVCT